MIKEGIALYDNGTFEKLRSGLVKVREFVRTDPQGLIADLADGYYVVTVNMYKHLQKLGVRFEEKELVDGVPRGLRDYVKEKVCRKRNGSRIKSHNSSPNFNPSSYALCSFSSSNLLPKCRRSE